MPFAPWVALSGSGSALAYQFRPENYGATANGIQTLVTTVAGSPNITAASPVFTSTSVDGGKDLMVCGAGGAIPGGPWITQIQSVTDSTHAVMTSNCPTGGSGSGLACVFSTDNRLAIDSCMTAQAAYELANADYGQMLFLPGIYGLGANLFQSQQGVSGATLTYNTQVRLPVPTDQTGETGGKMETRLTGAGTGGHCQFWMSTNLNLPATALVSYANGPNSPSGTFGQQSIVGGPSAGSGTVGGDSGFFNAKAVIEGIALVQPGWSNSIGFDVIQMPACRIDGVTSTAFAPSTNDGGGVNPYNAWPGSGFWASNKIDAGFRLPNMQNNDEVLLNSVSVQGLNNAIVTYADHVLINRFTSNSINNVINFKASAGAHSLQIFGASCENHNGFLVTGGGSGPIEVMIWLDSENAGISGQDVNDSGNALTGILYWSDTARTASGLASVPIPVVTGAANLQIHNKQLTRQVYDAHAYAYTLGTAFQNPWWETMWITLNSGTTTGLLIGPTSATCTTSVGTVTTSPVSFKLPTGWWLNIQGTVKPTTFNAVPD